MKKMLSFPFNSWKKNDQKTLPTQVVNGSANIASTLLNSDISILCQNMFILFLLLCSILHYTITARTLNSETANTSEMLPSEQNDFLSLNHMVIFIFHSNKTMYMCEIISIFSFLFWEFPVPWVSRVGIKQFQERYEW